MGILEKLGLKKKKQEGSKETGTRVLSEKKEDERPTKKAAKRASQAYRILRRPILSEKATKLASSGKYIFEVHPKAVKPEIAKSVESLYGVSVKSVKILKVAPKLKRYGRSQGMTASWKKAIVSVEAGEKIPGIVEAVG